MGSFSESLQQWVVSTVSMPPCDEVIEKEKTPTSGEITGTSVFNARIHSVL